jgi:hypothetical protein
MQCQRNVSILGPIQLHIQCVPRFISLWVERPEREAGHLLPSKFETKNVWRFFFNSSMSFWYGAWEQMQNFHLSEKFNINAESYDVLF